MPKVGSGPDIQHVLTATLEEEQENMEFVGILPTEEVRIKKNSHFAF